MADDKPRRPTGTIPLGGMKPIVPPSEALPRRPAAPAAPAGSPSESGRSSSSLPALGQQPPKRTLTGMVPIVSDPKRTATGMVPLGTDPKRTATGMVPIGGGPYKPPTGSGASPLAGGQQARDPRVPLVVPVRYRYESFIDFVQTQSMNVSRSGMFVSGNDSLPVGTILDFEFVLADGFAILRGKAEVVRVSKAPSGLGVRFQKLDEASRKLIDRIVEVNAGEGKKPTVSLDFTEAAPASTPGSSPSLSGLEAKGAATPSAPGVVFDNRDLKVRVNPVTVGYFLHNPLLNIRLGGFVVPSAEDVPLGTMFNLEIEDVSGRSLFSGKGKVVAKHEFRLGIRLVFTDKAAIAPLQAEITKLVPGGK